MDRTLTSSSLRADLPQNAVWRGFAPALLRRFDMALTIANPVAGVPFKLRSVSHRRYYTYRKRSAVSVMQMCSLIRRGDTVLEVGGHIGCLSQFFARQVGPTGQVHVFEPGRAQQRLLRDNLAQHPQCAHVDAAVANRVGKAMFFEDGRGGFDDSLDPSMPNPETPPLHATQPGRLIRDVHTVTLDDYATRLGLSPDFIKVDARGSELAVLQGARGVLQDCGAALITVSQQSQAVRSLLHAAGFDLTTVEGTPIRSAAEMTGKVFAVRPGQRLALTT
ncbi:MAG: FkbM family methyltransferase [Pseudomonadota bacterium]